VTSTVTVSGAGGTVSVVVTATVAGGSVADGAGCGGR
jgi:hypothetical protein